MWQIHTDAKESSGNGEKFREARKHNDHGPSSKNNINVYMCMYICFVKLLRTRAEQLI